MTDKYIVKPSGIHATLVPVFRGLSIFRPSGAEHDYDFAFHAAGNFRTSLELKPREPLPYLHVDKVSEARSDNDWWAQWEQAGVCYRLIGKGAPGTVVYTGVGPGKNPTDRIPMIIIRRHAKQTVYECRHEFNTKEQ